MVNVREPNSEVRAAPLTEGIRASVADLVHGYARIVRESRGHDCNYPFAPAAVYEIREADPSEEPTAYTVRNRLEGAKVIAEYIGSASSSAVAHYPPSAHKNCGEWRYQHSRDPLVLQCFGT